MAYLPDLSVRPINQPGSGLRNVGWLDGWHVYPKGSVNEDWIERLWLFRNQSTPSTRGYHPCPICHRWALPGFARKPTLLTHAGISHQLGSRELRVFADSVDYATPDMIIHYVARHGYLPPAEFIEAVLRGPQPGSREYLERFHSTEGSSLDSRDSPLDSEAKSTFNLFRAPVRAFEGVQHFEDEPSAIEIEETAHFMERARIERIVHADVTTERVVVQAGLGALAAARLRKQTVLVSLSGSDFAGWAQRNGLTPEPGPVRLESATSWADQLHTMRFDSPLDASTLSSVERLIAQYYSRDFMIDLDCASAVLEPPQYDSAHQRVEFFARTPHHDDIWTAWWRDALAALSCGTPKLICYQGERLG